MIAGADPDPCGTVAADARAASDARAVSDGSARIGAIDALRGIGVLLVVVQHALESIWRAGPAAPAGRALIGTLVFETVNLGRLGVMLFFLVSGFVIPASLGRGAGIRRFAIMRFFRLYPIYWVSIGAALLLAGAGGPGPFTAGQVIANASMIQRVFGQPDMIGVYWTLFFELAFYAACVALFRMRLLHRPAVLAGCAFALLAVAVLPVVLRAAAGSAMPSPVDPVFVSYMFTGAVLRMGVIEHRPGARRLGWLLLAAQAVAAPLIAGMLAPVISNRNAFLPPVALLGGYWGALALFAFCMARAHTAAPAPLRGIGRISYSMYLNQGAMLGLALLIVPPRSDAPSEIVFLAVAIVATILPSILTYRWIERPCVAAGNRFGARFAAGAGVARSNGGGASGSDRAAESRQTATFT